MTLGKTSLSGGAPLQKRSVWLTMTTCVALSCGPLSSPSTQSALGDGALSQRDAHAATTPSMNSGSTLEPSVQTSTAKSGTSAEVTSGTPSAARDQEANVKRNGASNEPNAVTPPFDATSSPGDGVWRPFGEDQDGALFWRTELHPNERSRFVSVSVVAVDLTRFRLEWVVGAGDTGAALLSDVQSPGLVSASSAPRVAAVFNGGFQARHGRWGQHSHGVTLVEPRVEGCGIALYRDGKVAMGSFQACNHPELLTYRQTPPCLLAGGTINRRLVAGQDAIWAGNSLKEKTRRRSAVGLTADGQTLFYLVGVEARPLDLARALRALGAEYGLQLDINWNWTRFFLVDGAHDGLTHGAETPASDLGEPLLEGMVADKGEYLRRPSKRDFFAIVRRSAER